MQFFLYSARHLSIFASVRANVFAFVDSWIFPPLATFFQTTILIFQYDIFLFLYLGQDTLPKVAGASLQYPLSFFDSFQQKQKQIGRIPFYLFAIFRLSIPPNLVAKKFFEEVMKFVRPMILGEYMARGISYLGVSSCSDNKYRNVACHFFAF